MTTQQAILAMKIGCKIRADWMRVGLYYYIHDNNVHCNDAWDSFMNIDIFSQSFDNCHNWYIV